PRVRLPPGGQPGRGAGIGAGRRCGGARAAGRRGADHSSSTTGQHCCGAGRAMSRFTHLDESGQARMVDVTEKAPTVRSATATALVRCAEHVVTALRDGSVPKGDVLAVARVAGIAGAKRTPELLPLAHVIG